MQIIRVCPRCGRSIKVNQHGKLLGHYFKHGGWKDGTKCPGSFHTVNEAKEEKDGDA